MVPLCDALFCRYFWCFCEGQACVKVTPYTVCVWTVSTGFSYQKFWEISLQKTSVAMASSCLQICALLLALAGFTTLLVTTMSSRWKVLDTTTELVTADWVSEGLWMDCAAAAVGSVQCKRFLYMLSSDRKWLWHMFITSRDGFYSFFWAVC